MTNDKWQMTNDKTITQNFEDINQHVSSELVWLNQIKFWLKTNLFNCIVNSTTIRASQDYKERILIKLCTHQPLWPRF